MLSAVETQQPAEDDDCQGRQYLVARLVRGESERDERESCSKCGHDHGPQPERNGSAR